MKKRIALTAKDIALIGMMTATIEAAKWALSFLPNVELVSFLIILYTLFFGKLIFLVIPVFVLLEGCIYGFGLWWIMYLYAWPILAALTLLFRSQKSAFFWSVLSGAFGLLFGALCAIPYLFISGVSAAVSWWIAGIPFDIIHCIANFLICMVLFPPMRSLLTRLKASFG
jgi:energy-coupling factor transport system substrate-specific component